MDFSIFRLPFPSKTYYIVLVQNKVQYMQGGESTPAWKWISAWQKWINGNMESQLFNPVQGLPN